MTHQDISREAARQDNGQFGTQPLAEVDVDLFDEDAEEMHSLGNPACPAVHGGTCSIDGHDDGTGDDDIFNGPDPVADALRADGLGGPVFVRGPGQLAYTDTTDGSIYDVQFMPEGLQVRSEDTDAMSYRTPFGSGKKMQPEDVGDALRTVIDQARDIRAMSAALSEWASTDAEDRGIDWADPEIDTMAGTLNGDGFTITGFSRDGEFRSPEMTVTVSEGDGDPIEFRYFRMKDGTLNVIRDGSQAPLAHWEVQALDSQVTSQMRRDGSVRELGMIFRNALAKADRR